MSQFFSVICWTNHCVNIDIIGWNLTSRLPVYQIPATSSTEDTPELVNAPVSESLLASADTFSFSSVISFFDELSSAELLVYLVVLVFLVMFLLWHFENLKAWFGRKLTTKSRRTRSHRKTRKKRNVSMANRSWVCDSVASRSQWANSGWKRNRKRYWRRNTNWVRGWGWFAWAKRRISGYPWPRLGIKSWVQERRGP